MLKALAPGPTKTAYQDGNPAAHRGIILRSYSIIPFILGQW